MNGIGIAYANVPPIIMTLGTQGALQGLVLVYTNGGGSATAPAGLQTSITTNFLGLPKQAWIWLVIAIGATIMLNRGTLGRRLYAIGTNANAVVPRGQSGPGDARCALRHIGAVRRSRGHPVDGIQRRRVLLARGSVPVRDRGGGRRRGNVDPGGRRNLHR